MTHALKTWPKYFQAVMDGSKTFEIRKDDRPFEVGDVLILQEYETKECGYAMDAYTGREEKKIISYILRNGNDFGLKTGYVILGIKD